MYLSLLVVVAGLCSLGLEMTALTLLAPYFGTTQLVWACVIGSTLFFLAAGYVAGGRLADRSPTLKVLATILATAGLGVTLIPSLTRPVLSLSMKGHSYLAMGLGLVACLAILAGPTFLLGMTSPFAVKLALRSVQDAGRAAGNLFALSTFGSLVGTFVPVLVLTPCLGTAATFHTFGLLLSLAAFPGLWASRLRVLCLAGWILQAWLFSHPYSSIKAAEGGEIIYESQSAYNYIQVRQRSHPSGGKVRQLYLNESWAAHSVYNTHYEETRNPEDLLVHTYWDFAQVAPFLYPNRPEGGVKSLAMIGTAAGTIPQMFLALYGDDAVVDGVEIDPAILEVGRRFFGLHNVALRCPNFHVEALDGRVFINRMQRQYDLVIIDCFRWPYVPAHLVTRECFEKVKRHLTSQGVLVVKCDRGLMGLRITATLKSVYPQVFQLLGMAIAVRQPVGDGITNLAENRKAVVNPVLRTIMAEALETRDDPIRPFAEWKRAGPVLTDDHSPTEFLVHRGALERLLRRP